MTVQDLRRAIEPLKARARDRASARRREFLQPSCDLMLRVESAERSAAVIAETLRALADSIPGLYPFRRLAQGGWLVGLAGSESIESSGRRPRHARSRIEVCVTIREGGGAVQLVCRRTALDRDLDALRHELLLANASEQALTEWIEGACLEFAAALLARRATLVCTQPSA